MVKNRDDNWYYKLLCGHIRLISNNKVKVVKGETEVYCKKCDNFAIVLERAERQ